MQVKCFEYSVTWNASQAWSAARYGMSSSGSPVPLGLVVHVDVTCSYARHLIPLFAPSGSMNPSGFYQSMCTSEHSLM
jgi:hypothetical protein